MKRLIVCCDGTWNDSVSTNSPLTNVARFSRCIEGQTDDGILQIVYYHTGVGVGTSSISNSIDGAVGRGLGANVRNTYSFLCQNFNHLEKNDEIYLVGFSRGAFTVRCLASMIDSVGLLTKLGLCRLYKVYELWKTQSTVGDSEGIILRKYLEGLPPGYLSTNIKIKACGVWDTVSAIGIQLPMWMPQKPTKRLAHVNTRIPGCIEHAFHALALNERRSAFFPLLWSNADCHINLQQCWFLGVHSDVGGGYEDIGLTNVAFIWMIAQFQHFTPLAFNDTDLRMTLVGGTAMHEFWEEIKEESSKQATKSRKEFEKFSLQRSDPETEYNSLIRAAVKILTEPQKLPVYRAGDAGRITNSLTFSWRLFGQRSRKPGMSFSRQNTFVSIDTNEDSAVVTDRVPQREKTGTNVHDGEEEDDMVSIPGGTQELLQTACETIHSTARILLSKQYRTCRSLKKYYTASGGVHSPNVCWHSREDESKGKRRMKPIGPPMHLSLHEATVTDEEMKLLVGWLDYSAARKARIGSFLKRESEGDKRIDQFFESELGCRSSVLPSSHAVRSEIAGRLRTLVDNTKDSAALDIWIALYAHLGEFEHPTLMYNSNDTDASRAQ